MLIYEVNIRLDPAIRTDYAALVKRHRERLLQLEGFESADWFERRAKDEGGEPDGAILWTIHYRVRDRECLEAYFNTTGPELRSESKTRFGDKVQVQRRILERLAGR